MIVVLMCLPFNLTFKSLLLIGFHPIRHFSKPFLRMMASPSWCWSSSLPEYSTVSPVLILCLPEPVHLLSLITKTWGCNVSSQLWLEPAFLSRIQFLHSRIQFWSCIWRSRLPSSCQRFPFGFHHCHSYEYLSMTLKARLAQKWWFSSLPFP